MSVRLGIAINDPDNGCAQGFIEAADFTLPEEPDTFLFLDVPHLTCYWDDKRRKLRIGRRLFPISGYSTWTGNWCWDSASVTHQVAAQIANYLRSRGASPNMGWKRPWDKWQSGKRFTARDFEIREDD